MTRPRISCIHPIMAVATTGVWVFPAVAAPPNDPDFDKQWGIHNSGQVVEGITGTAGADMDALGAWAIHGGARSVLVAIVGTGVNPHVEFADRLLEGYVSSRAGGDPYSTFDTGINGTRAAGIVAAARNNAVGVAGLNDRALILPVRVALGGTATPESVAEGIVWAANQQADIILVLVQFYDFDPSLADAVSYASARGCLVIAGAGHTGEGVVAYPAALDGCFAVSPTTNQDASPAYGNYGSEVDVAAPGDRIWSTSAGGGYGYESNESSFSAAAYVAGVASLIRSYAPQLDSEAIGAVLTETADDIGEPGSDDHFGAGRINAKRALEAAQRPLLRFEPVDVVPQRIVPALPTRFTVHIANVAGVLSATSPQLLYRTSPGAFNDTIRLEALGGGNYVVPLPAAPCDTVMEYFLLAATQTGLVTLDPPGAPLQLFRATADPTVTLFADDFEDDLGWTTEVSGVGTTGGWVRVAPVGTFLGLTPVQPAYDRTPDDGQGCFITGQHFGGNAGTGDVDFGPVMLTSPVVQIGSTNEVEVSYEVWFYSASGTPDELHVEFSRNGGATWVPAETVSENTAGWERRAFQLGDSPSAAGSELRVRFVVSDDPSDSLTEAGIDAFRVDSISCNSLAGDVDLDGDVDLVDLGKLGNCILGPGVPATSNCRVFDANSDGDVDLADAGWVFDAFRRGR